MAQSADIYDESFLRVLKGYTDAGSGSNNPRSATQDPSPGYAPKDVTITSHGTSIWSQTFKLTITNATLNTSTDYFLKTAKGPNGKLMMSGEFVSMSTIHRITPSFCPIPIGWGTYDSDPSTHFFLCEFINMGNAPSTYRNDAIFMKHFCSSLATLHRESVSPNGKFGFDVPTCNGSLPQDNTWNSSWEGFFANGFRHMLRQYERVKKKRDEELEELAEVFFEKVIPRLLRPLESKGRKVKPSLVHGDLWFGNSAVVKGKQTTMVFDACCFYAHNEYELGNWKPGRNRFSQKWFKTYLEEIGGKSEPKADFADRNTLYAIRFNLHAAILFPDKTGYRTFVVDDMRALNKKFENVDLSTL